MPWAFMHIVDHYFGWVDWGCLHWLELILSRVETLVPMRDGDKPTRELSDRPKSI